MPGTIWDRLITIEYDWAADWVAARPEMGNGGPGTELPRNLSGAVKVLIDQDQEAFARRVMECRYARAMESHNANNGPSR